MISGSHGGGMKMAVFWMVAPCCLVEDFSGTWYLHHQSDDDWGSAPMVEAASASETSVTFYQSIRRKNPGHYFQGWINAAEIGVQWRFLLNTMM
jgi:hypothetical protein